MKKPIAFRNNIFKCEQRTTKDGDDEQVWFCLLKHESGVELEVSVWKNEDDEEDAEEPFEAAVNLADDGAAIVSAHITLAFAFGATKQHALERVIDAFEENLKAFGDLLGKLK